MIIKDTPQYQLRCTVREYAPDTFDLTLEQHFPKANHPFWSRLCQLNLNQSELDSLAVAILRKDTSAPAPGELWQRIKHARKAARLTQEDLASKLGVSRVAVAHWEAANQDTRDYPEAHRLQDIASALNVSAGWLVSGQA
jgi:DNA-binding XRE family transcriptional regulator